MIVRDDLLLVRISLQTLGNRFRSMRAAHSRLDLLMLSGAAQLLAAYLFSRVDELLAGAAATARLHTSLLGWVAAGLIVLVGTAAGAQRRAARGRATQETWLAVLPWPLAARRRAALVASLCDASMPTVIVGLLAFWSTAKLGGGMLEAAGAATLFVAAFAAAALALHVGRTVDVTASAEIQAGPRGRRPAWIRYLRWTDTARPRWIGVWDAGRSGARLTWISLAAFVVFGGGAAVASIAQASPWAAAAIAVLGGNALFAAVLQGKPLVSAACRTLPLGFFAAWLGLLRLPVALSFSWFLPLGVVAALTGGAEIAGSAAGALLTLDLIYAVLTAFSPASKLFTLLFYAGVLVTAATESFELGLSVWALVAAFLAVLLWMGRRRYRVYG